MSTYIVINIKVNKKEVYNEFANRRQIFPTHG